MNRVKKMLEERRIKRWKISTKLLLLILVMGAVSLGLFWFLWVHQADAATFLESSGLVKWFDSEEFEENLQREAKNYSVPAAEDDTEGQKEIQPFLDSVTDEYTGVYVYGQDDGLYRCGQITDIMRVYPFGSLLSMSQEILGSQYGDIPVEFQNGTFDVIYYSYHRSQFIYPYMIFSILLCVFVFLAGILVFMGRVMKRIFKVKDKISNMAQGDLAHPVPSGLTDRFRGIAAKHAVVLILSLFEFRAPGLYHNTAAVIDADGSFLGKYRKMHIPQDPGFEEKFYFAPGDLGFRAFDTKYGRIGVIVCWDQWYPESARLTALQGAKIIFCPTAIGGIAGEGAELAALQRDAWLNVQRGHAVANGCYYAAVNRVGIEHGTRFWGSSFVCDFYGNHMTLGSEEECAILYAECDFRAMEEHRRMWPFFRDRRIDAYENLTRRFND